CGGAIIFLSFEPPPPWGGEKGSRGEYGESVFPLFKTPLVWWVPLRAGLGGEVRFRRGGGRGGGGVCGGRGRGGVVGEGGEEVAGLVARGVRAARRGSASLSPGKRSLETWPLSRPKVALVFGVPITFADHQHFRRNSAARGRPGRRLRPRMRSIESRTSAP